MFTKTEIELAKPCVEAIKKISKAKGKKWEWKPETGDWCIVLGYSNAVGLIGLIEKDINVSGLAYVECNVFIPKFEDNDWYEREKLVPLLHWEKLEKIMEDLEYELSVYKVANTLDAHECFRCEIWEEDNILCAYEEADTRQEAVMRAIIRLGEEIRGE